ncbi:hypothetical protein TREMEDRAFT_66307 [Tremella mesenterica DSM 1558]|uniref:uncharacterized protein n=1 Tax=Tremella mesenterica (strain ATCC 24925 / CBS 8224 / DSM 1558 / NBRC 9311 / NRRL Y-6157 / RJB 2259-6 / UBC 559-6) TaxID=578456 RepID=UPI00032C0371|nr:uncharacterized protein TREMEDRAFT_66307 [Tremella mesenterica DSM 1558]EIW65710.1 hypothetical protein TREMEDRAFT_66307 [Tremella mesenterica DSM 1558]
MVRDSFMDTTKGNPVVICMGIVRATEPVGRTPSSGPPPVAGGAEQSYIATRAWGELEGFVHNMKKTGKSRGCSSKTPDWRISCWMRMRMTRTRIQGCMISIFEM